MCCLFLRHCVLPCPAAFYATIWAYTCVRYLCTCTRIYCMWVRCMCVARTVCNGNPRLCAAPLHMALLLSVWEELGLCLGVRGGRPVCLGGAGGGLKDNWRSLFRQPLVDPCRSGARFTDQSKRVCAPLGPWGHFSAFKQVSLMR